MTQWPQGHLWMVKLSLPLGGVVSLGVTQRKDPSQGRFWVIKLVYGQAVGFGVTQWPQASQGRAPLGGQLDGQGVCLGVTQWPQGRLCVVKFPTPGCGGCVLT